ncbi:hypothetical protein DFR30_1252 [Thiogranum longum]|uniref:Uncharacterized protein n=1 Tax=Thiogranum longum TaxID=1537524 RepID=A0A4R1HBT3_9GAMM|nr:hypothetical protein [Thiogranum longum]TCK17993.1 hypothetical protein DFR30_1252 [Thiogranum longum]
MDEDSGQTDPANRKHSPKNIEELHREVKKWRSEHDTWLEDVEKWRREERYLKLLLFRMERALPDEGSSLDEHARRVKDHVQRVGAYEKRLQALMKKGNPYSDIDDTLLEEHRLQKNLHLQERERHASFRNSHEAAMFELTRLTRALEQAERQ